MIISRSKATTYAMHTQSFDTIASMYKQLRINIHTFICTYESEYVLYMDSTASDTYVISLPSYIT